MTASTTNLGFFRNVFRISTVIYDIDFDKNN